MFVSLLWERDSHQQNGKEKTVVLQQELVVF